MPHPAEWAVDACADHCAIVGADTLALGDVIRTPDPSDPACGILVERVVAVLPGHAVAQVIQGNPRLPVGSFVAYTFDRAGF